MIDFENYYTFPTIPDEHALKKNTEERLFFLYAVSLILQTCYYLEKGEKRMLFNGT